MEWEKPGSKVEYCMIPSYTATEKAHLQIGGCWGDGEEAGYRVTGEFQGEGSPLCRGGYTTV